METGKAAPERIFAIYSRKSKYTGKGESIENQIEMCRRHIRLKFGAAAADNAAVFEDEGFSGGNLDRPEFKLLMNEVKKKRIEAVVCYRLDRISRNIGDFANLMEEFNDLGTSFISIKEDFDTSTAMGRAMMSICAVFSQLERETIAERIRDNMRELSKTGRWLGGVTPTGYESESVKNVTVDGKIRKSCKLKMITGEAALVKLIYDKFIQTRSLTAVDKYLFENGYKTKNNKHFSRCAIRNILTNPVYMIGDNKAYDYLVAHEADLFSAKEAFDGVHGLMIYNKTIQKRGKSTKMKPMDEWIVAIGKHKGLISSEDWLKAQQILAQNASKSWRVPRSNAALLSGVLYCAHCGAYLRPKASKRLNSEGEAIYTYVCCTKERSKSYCCSVNVVNGNLLDKMVVNHIKTLAEDRSLFIKELRASGKRLFIEKEPLLEDIDSLNTEIRELNNKINALVTALAMAEKSAVKYIHKQINEMDGEKEKLSKRRDDLASKVHRQSLEAQEYHMLGEALADFSTSINYMSLEEKRNAIRTVIKKIVWDGKQADIYFFGAEENLPMAEKLEDVKDETCQGVNTGQ